MGGHRVICMPCSHCCRVVPLLWWHWCNWCHFSTHSAEWCHLVHAGTICSLLRMLCLFSLSRLPHCRYVEDRFAGVGPIVVPSSDVALDSPYSFPYFSYACFWLDIYVCWSLPYCSTINGIHICYPTIVYVSYLAAADINLTYMPTFEHTWRCAVFIIDLRVYYHNLIAVAITNPWHNRFGVGPCPKGP